MSGLRFKRFTKTGILKSIGKNLLDAFLHRVNAQIEPEQQFTIPDVGLEEDQYFTALSSMFMSPELLPVQLNETLYAIDEMASDVGMERLQQGVEAANITIPYDPNNTTAADYALQVWMTDPTLLSRKHNEMQLHRLSSFEYHQAALRPADGEVFTPPDRATLANMCMVMDQWFSRHNRGQETTRIETYLMDGEYWFLIRHGEPLARTPKVEQRRTEIMHFRPEKDDVVVYHPNRGEIRINAQIKGIKELYRTVFGESLFGDANHFSVGEKYKLTPLVEDTATAVEPIPGIDQITLLELEYYKGYGQNFRIIHRADDILAINLSEPYSIREGSVLKRAVFEVLFTGATKSRKVEIRPPNLLKLGRHCDAAMVEHWLLEKRFINPRGRAGEHVPDDTKEGVHD